jgi:CRISPR-associated protein Cas1
MKKPVYIFSNGELKRQQNTLRFDGDKGMRMVPVETTSELHVFGEVSLNTRALNFLTQHGIPLHVYNYYGYYAGSYMPREQYVSGYLTLQQATHYTDYAKRLELAQAFVAGALRNLEKVLMYYQRRGVDVQSVLEVFRASQTLVPHQPDIESLMALEGNARNAYYQAWDNILNDEDFKFEGRTKRPPLNRVNALISFGNSLMYVTCLSEIYRTHLDPRIGFLHTTNYRRYSLNLDLAEIFKPIIVDRVIFTLINKGMLSARDFSKEGGGIFLKESARQTFVKAYDERLKDTFKLERLKRHVSYKRLIRMECYKLEKHLIGDEVYRPYVARW